MTKGNASRRTPMDRHDSTPKRPAKLGPDIKAKIGRHLRVWYDEVIAEGVPKRFEDILARLDDEDEGDSAKNSAKDAAEGAEEAPLETEAKAAPVGRTTIPGEQEGGSSA
jgi:hypothetical protein